MCARALSADAGLLAPRPAKEADAEAQYGAKTLSIGDRLQPGLASASRIDRIVTVPSLIRALRGWNGYPLHPRGQRRRGIRIIRVSCCATRCPEPPPRPAPGWVEAPICQRPGI